MPNGDTPMQYPFPYKNASGTGEDPINSLYLSSTTQTEDYTDGVGALVVVGGAQFQSDVFIKGNLYVAGKIYQSSFTPILSDTVGTVTYTQQSGLAATSADGRTVVFSLSIECTYVGATGGQITIAGFPAVTGNVVGYCSNTETNQTIPLGGQFNAGTLLMILRQNNSDYVLTGSGTLNITVSGFYCTSTAVGNWTPTFASTAGALGSLTYNTRQGLFSEIGDMVVYHTNLNVSYSGSSSTALTISGFPSTSISKQIGSHLIQTTNLENPLCFNFQTGVNTANILNTNLNTSIGLSGTGVFTMLGSGMYLKTGLPNTYTPVLSGNGGGSISYSTQSGRWGKTLNVVYFTIDIVATFSEASLTNLKVSLPSKNGQLKVVTSEINTSLDSPCGGLIDSLSTTMSIYNQSTKQNAQLLGSGSVRFNCTWFYLANS